MPKHAQISGWIVNREEMSGILAVSPTTLDRYVRSGCPLLERGTTSQGHKFNTGAVIGWLRQRDAEAGDPTDAARSQAEERRRPMAASAELKELQLAEKRGLMISVEDVVPIVADELAEVRSRLMALPGRLAQGLVGMQDAAAIEGAIRDEIAAALSELTQG
jgi:phage terminase Nu1 subunit (DNA packaging protein)